MVLCTGRLSGRRVAQRQGLFALPIQKAEDKICLLHFVELGETHVLVSLLSLLGMPCCPQSGLK